MIELVDDARAKETAAVLKQELLRDLRRANPQAANVRIVLAVRDRSGETVGGLTGSTSYGWLLIEVLWVREAFRRKGWGRSLVARAMREAREHGCHAVWVDTSDRSACAFYKAMGFQVFGELGNHPGQAPEGHRRWFLRRDLGIAA